MLTSVLRKLYYNNENPLLSSVVNSGGFSQVLVPSDHLKSLRERASTLLAEIADAREKVTQKKEELVQTKEEKESLLALKASQERVLTIEKTKQESQVQEVAATLSELQARLSKVGKELSVLLGGSYDTDDITEAVKFASKKTGVRKEFLFAMLDKESDLGRFTGGCTYKKSKMGSKNEEIFKRIAKGLGYDYKKLKVSCPLSYGIGGAMGVAQFMPTTWVGYESTITSYTGHNPPDPWNLTDGVVGMAEKLKRAGAANKSKEHYAATVYYCGSRLGRAVCQNYANTVISWAKGYDDFF